MINRDICTEFNSNPVEIISKLKRNRDNILVILTKLMMNC